MAYRRISAEFKVNVVLKLLEGNKPTALEKEYKIPRKTLYEWKDRAIAALHQAFRDNKPGPKTVRPETLLDCDTISQNLEQGICQCTQCTSGQLVKNGIYRLKSGSLRQRYICKICLVQITIEKKTPE